MSEAHEDEELQVRRLRKRLPPDGPGALAERVVSGALAWHRLAFPPTPGAARSLEPWERRWLEQKREHWRCGDPSALRALLPEVRAERARWFVLLRAEGGAKTWLDEALSESERPRTLVIGPAGAGKSVLLQHLAWVLTAVALGEPLEPDEAEPAHRLNLAALRGKGPILPVPILHTASTLASFLRTTDGSGERPIGEALTALLCSPDTFGADADPVAVRRGLESGRYLLLFDSLDEVPDQRDRERIVRQLGTLKGPVRVVLSTRPLAQTAVSTPPGFVPVSIAPLDNERIERLTRVWLLVHEIGTSSISDALTAIRATRPTSPLTPTAAAPPRTPCC